MRKFYTYLAGAALGALAISQPARALPFANGSFTIVPAIGAGPVTVNTGHITLGTSSKHEPALVVQAVAGNLALAIPPGNSAVLSNSTLPVPPGVGNPLAVNFTMTVGGLVFAFDTAVTNSRVALNPGLNIAG